MMFELVPSSLGFLFSTFGCVLLVSLTVPSPRTYFLIVFSFILIE